MKKLLVVVALAGSAVACAKSAPAPATPASPSAAAPALKPAGEATVGDVTSCPVSGETFTVTPSSPKAEYDGKTYYFCCPGCDREFAKDPQKYLKKK